MSDKFSNWVYIDPDMPEGMLFIWMTEKPSTASEFCDTLKSVLKSPRTECAHPFTHLFTRYDTVDSPVPQSDLSVEHISVPYESQG